MARNVWRRACWALVLCTLAGVAFGGSRSEVRKQIEAARVYTGTIDFDETGRVVALDFKDADKLGATGSDWFRSHLKQWQFEPVVVDGTPRQARTHARVMLVAKQLPGEQVSLRVASADFTGDPAEEANKSNEYVRSKRLQPPQFPKDLARRGVSGTVYLVLRVGRDGKVADAAAERVNLRVLASDYELQRVREKLASNALQVARNWEFIPPTAGAEVDSAFWRVRVPVDYIGPGARPIKETEWTAYIPGPLAVIPWLDYEDVLPPDALAGGGIYPVRKDGIRLKTALD